MEDSSDDLQAVREMAALAQVTRRSGVTVLAAGTAGAAGVAGVSS
jgi:hypothetical protein